MSMAQVAYGPVILYPNNALLQSTDQTGLISRTWERERTEEVSMLKIYMNY